MKKNRMLRWVSAASCALLCAAANATERFSDNAEAFKTYAEVCGAVEQIQSLNAEFSDVEKARQIIELKITQAGGARAQAAARKRSEFLMHNSEIILSNAKGLGFHADEKINDLRTYIHEKSPLVFAYLLSSSLYTMSYEFAIQHRDVFSTVDTENAARIQSTANTWITEIQAKATKEVEYAAELFVALSFSPLREKQHENARRIIESFPQESEPRLHLQSAFDAVLTRPARPIPTGDRLIIYREIADKLFRKKDEV